MERYCVNIATHSWIVNKEKVKAERKWAWLSVDAEIINFLVTFPRTRSETSCQWSVNRVERWQSYGTYRRHWSLSTGYWQLFFKTHAVLNIRVLPIIRN